MSVFIYVDIGFEPVYSYQKPPLEEIRNYFPDLTCLDLDAYSDEFLISQACELVEQSAVAGIYLNSLDAEAPLGATLRLVEIFIRRSVNSLVILRGPHTRLERLFINRSHLTFLNNTNEELIREQVAEFYTNGAGR